MEEYDQNEVLEMLQGAQALHPLMGDPQGGVIAGFQQEHGLAQTMESHEPAAPQAQNSWDFLKGPGA